LGEPAISPRSPRTAARAGRWSRGTQQATAGELAIKRFSRPVPGFDVIALHEAELTQA